MRPRIRTLKPEIWEDEKVGDLSHGARLLFIGLITMADDEGRLRDLLPAIRGYVFPHDPISHTKLAGWLDEVERSGMIVRYEVEGRRYMAFPHWSEHQKVDRPTDSKLPPPPVTLIDPSPNDRGDLDEDSSKDRRDVDEGSRPTRARAVDPIRSRSLPLNDCGKSFTVEDEPPNDFPNELRPHLDLVCGVLRPLAERQNAKAVSKRSLASLIADPTRRHKPFVRAAHDFAAWADSKAQPRRDVVAGWRNWLEKCDELAGVEQVSPRLQAVNGKRDYSKYDRAAGLLPGPRHAEPAA